MSYLNKNLSNRRRVQKNTTGTFDLLEIENAVVPGVPLYNVFTNRMKRLVEGSNINLVDNGESVVINSTSAIIGDTGPTGSTGATGVTGAAGVTGPSGPPMTSIIRGSAYGFTDQNSISNVMLGYNSNIGNLGSNNIILGRESALNCSNKNNNIFIGNDAISNGINNMFNNITIGSNLLSNSISDEITQNILLGNNLYKSIPITSIKMDNNLVFGNNIETNDNKLNMDNNIIVGNNINTCGSNSIILKNNNYNYISNKDHCLYIGKGNNQPSNDNEFIISNDYEKYKIYDIPSIKTNRFYLNASILDNTSIDPQTPQINPIPTDPNSFYKQMNTSAAIIPENTYTYIESFTGSPYTLVTSYAFITPINELKSVTIPGGEWGVKLWTTTNSSINDCRLFCRIYLYHEGVETFLFNTNVVPILGPGLYQQVTTASRPILVLDQYDRLVCKVYIYNINTAPTITVNTYFEGSSHYSYFYTPYSPPPPVSNFYLGYDSYTGEITKHEATNLPIDTTSQNKNILKKNEVGGLEFRSLIEGSGIIISENTDELSIQIDSGILPINMEPTVSGLAYGKQDQSQLFTGLGRELIPKDRSISIFNQSGAGDIQNYNGSDNILINNIDNQNNNTNAIMSNLITNNCVTKECNFDRSTLLASELSVGGLPMESCSIFGNFRGQNISNCVESLYLSSNAGPGNLNLNGRQSLYIGNSTNNDTVNDRDAYISGYDRFFLKTCGPSSGSETEYLTYSSSSGEVTRSFLPLGLTGPTGPNGLQGITGPTGSSGSGILAKQPTVLGTSYGTNSNTVDVEVCGRNSLTNYTGSPAQILRATSIGNNLYNSNLPALCTIVDLIAIGMTHLLPAATQLRNSIIIADNFIGNGLQLINNNTLINSNPTGFQINGALTSITGCNIYSSAIVNLNVDPINCNVINAGFTTTPGSRNMILAAGGNNSGNIDCSNGTGNTVIHCTGNNLASFNHPAFNGCCTINNGTFAVAPDSSNQIIFGHNTFRMPNNTTISSPAQTHYPVIYSQSGLIVGFNGQAISRVYRLTGNTGASGNVIFSPPGIAPNGVNVVITATVFNSSATTSYTCHCTAVTLTTANIQVFQSVNAMVGLPTMVPAGAGIIVNFMMAY